MHGYEYPPPRSDFLPSIPNANICSETFFVQCLPQPQVMELDPFWRPQTEEEREDEGEEGHLSVTNIARQYLDGVRKRKGLATNDKIVVAAEKQRTLTRNK